MSPCEKLPELAPDYHARAMTPLEAVHYEAHLATCAACRSADEEYRQGLEMLQPWPEEVSQRSDAEFLAAVLAAAGHQQRGGASAAPRTGPRLELVSFKRDRSAGTRSAWGPIALAASLLLLIGGLAWDASRTSVPGPATVELATVELDDSSLAWADLSGLENSLLEDELELSGLAGFGEGAALDLESVEDELWSELGRDAGLLDEPWPGAGPSLEDGIENLDQKQRAQLTELFEQG